MNLSTSMASRIMLLCSAPKACPFFLKTLYCNFLKPWPWDISINFLHPTTVLYIHSGSTKTASSVVCPCWWEYSIPSPSNHCPHPFTLWLVYHSFIYSSWKSLLLAGSWLLVCQNIFEPLQCLIDFIHQDWQSSQNNNKKCTASMEHFLPCIPGIQLLLVKFSCRKMASAVDSTN